MAYATDRLAEELDVVSPWEVCTASSAVLDAETHHVRSVDDHMPECECKTT
jgi:hypothetical protein